MESINGLLSQVSLISKKNAEILDASGGRFNMFQLCGVDHYENTHSRILAEFLNPNGTHGLKSKLLECFIETLGEYFTVEAFNCEKSRVRTEYSTKEGRIDILLEDDQNKAIIIENKIYANDQPEQLQRYSRYAQVNKQQYQILYLTLYGGNASKQSSEGVSYLPISYKESIIHWLEKCVAIASRYPTVRETIIQYINHLKQLTNQDMDTKNKNEITEVLSRIENLRAAQVIFRNYSATFNYIMDKHFNPKMAEFAKQKGLDYHFDKSEEFFVKFHFTNSNWQDKLWIAFTHEQNQCHYGLQNNLKKCRVSDENRKNIHKKLNELGVQSRKESEWWPFYANFTNLSLHTWESDIINSDNFLNDCKGKIEVLLKVMAGIEI